MIDGTDYWFPFLAIVAVLWILLASIDPLNKK